MECGLEVFGKSTDDRYEYKGDISYKKLYEDYEAWKAKVFAQLILWCIDDD